MVEFKRKEILNDDSLKKLLSYLIINHKVAEHTRKCLLKNSHIKNFCEISRHFISISNEIFIHYDVSSWYNKIGGASIRIDSIGVYDDFIEFEVCRMKELSNSNDSSIPNLN